MPFQDDEVILKDNLCVYVSSSTCFFLKIFLTSVFNLLELRLKKFKHNIPIYIYIIIIPVVLLSKTNTLWYSFMLRPVADKYEKHFSIYLYKVYVYICLAEIQIVFTSQFAAVL